MLGTYGFTVEVYHRTKNKTDSAQSLPENWMRGNTSQLNVWVRHYPNTKTRQGHYKKIKLYSPKSITDIVAKKVNKTLENSIQWYIKRIHHDQVRFNPGMHGWLNIQKPISVIHHVNRLNKKRKLHIYPRRCRKVFDQIQHPSLIKTHIRASLVAQWLRIRLPMQGTWVWALVHEVPTWRRATKPVCHSYWACGLEPAGHNYWSPCT